MLCLQDDMNYYENLHSLAVAWGKFMEISSMMCSIHTRLWLLGLSCSVM